MSSRKRLSREEHVVGISIQLLSLVVSPFLIYTFSRHAPFVRDCPTQYGRMVLSIFLAGIIATLVSYCLPIVMEELKRVSKIALLTGAAPVLGIAFALFQGIFTDDTAIDWLAILTASLAMCGALASFAESYPWNHSDTRWKQTLLFADLPLLLVCIAVVMFRLVVYDVSSEDFTNLVGVEVPHSQYRTPAIQLQLEQYLTFVRRGFWVGFSTGVVTVQLITSQIIAITLRWYEILSMTEAPSIQQTTLITDVSRSHGSTT